MIDDILYLTPILVASFLYVQRDVYYKANEWIWLVPKYGDFLNVQLIGSKNCINYDPTLTLRQLGCPILYKFDDQLLEGFLVHGKENPSMLKRIIRAWEYVHLRGRNMGKGIQLTKEPYYQWGIERSWDIKFPFILDPPTQPPPPEPILVSLEEVGELRASILILEQEKEELQNNLHKFSYERNELRFNLKEKGKDA